MLVFNANSVAIYRTREAGFTTHVKQRSALQLVGEHDVAVSVARGRSARALTC